ncbi:DUF5988 family protein [Streptomyces himalayensis]|uniref:Uncharacterized protein n=1 Tax=Streptomyces himalayensis subsp. himalayensis TaxID=2756131 RepID=A0A7W0IDJ3_9ACTN|nr:DUF5988 family protein [Streptomyces himalayensis]MBA2951798.1 hypothetical protein [Streptomyces himalayensis subsp. himalayensis]
MINIAVEGGPEGIGRVCEIDAPVVPERWTVAYYGRHHHFERTGAVVRVAGVDVPLFRFSYSTAIAE